MQKVRILALSLSLAVALSASVASAATTIGANISTGGTLTVTGTSTLGMINSGTWNGTTIDVANGGTGATDAAGARTNLGLTIGTDVQAFSQGLLDIAGIAHASSSFVVSDGANWIGLDGAGARGALGLAIGTDVQAYDATLAAITGGTWTGATSITDLGTITTGTWNGTSIDDANVDDNITVSGYLPLAGGTMAGAIDMDSYSINNLGGLLVAGSLSGNQSGNATSLYLTNSGMIDDDPFIMLSHNTSDASMDAIKLNMASGSGSFTGNFLNFLNNNVQQFFVTNNGSINTQGSITLQGGISMPSSNVIWLGADSSFGFWNDGTSAHIMTNDSTDRDLVINTGVNNSALFDGRVGIGTTTPDRKLVVEGDVLITGILDAGVTTVTGLNLNSNILSLGVNLTATGTNSIELISTGVTSLTLPTTGTLATLDGTEVFTNKSLTSPAITGAPTAAGATWADLGTVTTIDIDGGIIDGTIIGATTPADATFATGTFSGLVAPSGTSPSSGDACSVTGSISVDTDAAAGSRIIWCDGALWQDN